MKKFFPVPYIYVINIWLFAGRKNQPESSWTPAEKNQKLLLQQIGIFLSQLIANRTNIRVFIGIRTIVKEFRPIL